MSYPSRDMGLGRSSISAFLLGVLVLVGYGGSASAFVAERDELLAASAELVKIELAVHNAEVKLAAGKSDLADLIKKKRWDAADKCTQQEIFDAEHKFDCDLADVLKTPEKLPKWVQIAITRDVLNKQDLTRQKTRLAQARADHKRATEIARIEHAVHKAEERLAAGKKNLADALKTVKLPYIRMARLRNAHHKQELERLQAPLAQARADHKRARHAFDLAIAPVKDALAKAKQILDLAESPAIPGDPLNKRRAAQAIRRDVKKIVSVDRVDLIDTSGALDVLASVRKMIDAGRPYKAIQTKLLGLVAEDALDRHVAKVAADYVRGALVKKTLGEQLKSWDSSAKKLSVALKLIERLSTKPKDPFASDDIDNLIGYVTAMQGLTSSSGPSVFYKLMSHFYLEVLGSMEANFIKICKAQASTNLTQLDLGMRTVVVLPTQAAWPMPSVKCPFGKIDFVLWKFEIYRDASSPICKPCSNPQCGGTCKLATFAKESYVRFEIDIPESHENGSWLWIAPKHAPVPANAQEAQRMIYRERQTDPKGQYVLAGITPQKVNKENYHEFIRPDLPFLRKRVELPGKYKHRSDFRYWAPAPGNFIARLFEKTTSNDQPVDPISFEVVAINDVVQWLESELYTPGEAVWAFLRWPHQSIVYPKKKTVTQAVVPKHTSHGTYKSIKDHVLDKQLLNKGPSRKIADTLFRFAAPSKPGFYDVRLYDTSDEGQELAVSTFEVKAPPITVKATLQGAKSKTLRVH